jgi:NAD(P)-dependent dehydrogenase (short-subunit alcohol dehydrogenase family)
MAFGPTSTAAEVIDGVDLMGKVAVVTGSSGGIGLETARALASAGATVVLANRDSKKSDVAAVDLRRDVDADHVEIGQLDLTSLASVRDFAAWFTAHHDRLDLLVNNAGVMATPLGRTADGFELQFGTNHLGHFLLTNLLLPKLISSSPSRIVNLSSGAHRRGGINWDDPNYDTREYAPWESYGQSKSANILFAIELDRRLGAKGVHAYSVHPGVIATELDRYLTDQDRQWVDDQIVAGGITRKTPQQGAATTVLACTAPDLAAHGGISGGLRGSGAITSRRRPRRRATTLGHERRTRRSGVRHLTRQPQSRIVPTRYPSAGRAKREGSGEQRC